MLCLMSDVERQVLLSITGEKKISKPPGRRKSIPTSVERCWMEDTKSSSNEKARPVSKVLVLPNQNKETMN